MTKTVQLAFDSGNKIQMDMPAERVSGFIASLEELSKKMLPIDRADIGVLSGMAPGIVIAKPNAIESIMVGEKRQIKLPGRLRPGG